MEYCFVKNNLLLFCENKQSKPDKMKLTQICLIWHRSLEQPIPLFKLNTKNDTLPILLKLLPSHTTSVLFPEI